GAADAKIVFFENLNPNLYRVPFLPGQDSFLWPGNDFGAFWKDDASALVHFRPLTADPGSFLNVVEGSPDSAGSTLARDLEAAAKPGVAFAIGSRPAPATHQVGVDVFGILREGAPDLLGESGRRPPRLDRDPQCRRELDRRHRRLDRSPVRVRRGLDPRRLVFQLRARARRPCRDGRSAQPLLRPRTACERHLGNDVLR